MNNNLIDILKIEALKPPAAINNLTSAQLDLLQKNTDHMILAHHLVGEAVKYAIRVAATMRSIELGSRSGDHNIHVNHSSGEVIGPNQVVIG